MSRAKPWQTWLVDFGPSVGHEQGGVRPAVVVASPLHARFPFGMTIVVPLTSQDRGLIHHVPVLSAASGLRVPSWARTEDVTTIAEQRMLRDRPLGRVSEDEESQIRDMLRRMIDV